MKKSFIPLGTSFLSLSSALALTIAPVYADNMMHFSGQLSDQTCILLVDGSANGSPVVNLDPVKASSLQEAGSTARGNEFTLNVSGCMVSDNSFSVKVNFQPYNLTGPNDDSGAQSIIGNVGSAKNVDLHILNPATSKPIYYGDVIGGQNAGRIPISAGQTSGADIKYRVEYVSHQGGATPGTVIGRIQYAINYE